MIVVVRASTSSDLAAVAAAIEGASGLRLAVRAPGQLLASLDPPLLERLAAAGNAVEWLGGGWADPVLAMLPRRDRKLQLQADADAISTTMGATVAGAWLALGGWQGFLAETLALAGLRYALVDAAAFVGKVETGIVDHLGTPFVVMPIGEAAIPVPAGELGAVPTSSMLTPSQYLDLDLPTKRVTLVEDWPGEAGPGWRQRLALDPGAELLYRKMLRLSAKWGERSDRVPPPSQAAFLSAQSHVHYLGATERDEAHRLLVAARSADRRSGPILVTEDWDADGRDEIHFELSELSGVLDPGTTSLSYLDDKSVGWPVVMRPVHIEPLGAFASEVVELSEHRGRVQVRLDSPALETRFTMEGRRIEILLSKHHLDEMPVGPRLPINLRLAQARLRIDGGAWNEVGSALEVSGHRFRLQAGERGVVITLAKPGQVSIEAAGSELVLWPHAARALEMSMELT